MARDHVDFHKSSFVYENFITGEVTSRLKSFKTHFGKLYTDDYFLDRSTNYRVR